ncbi:MAG TPA: hypothetical protein VM187_08205, partial [Niastella sp.]|nr:hypothetical protein [Niastella sp.]
MHLLKCTFKCIALLLLLATTTQAQKKFNNWYFGFHAGISFNTPTPTLLPPTTMDQFEGCAAISDNTGALLFYTDGITVWDKNNNAMPNGTGLGGSRSTTQSSLIVPMPGDDEKYYLFTMEDETRSGDLRYSIVDMSLNAGNGDIIPGAKNIFLSTNNTEALVAANPTNCNTWVLTHQRDNNRFEARLVTHSGIGTPVPSNVGAIHNSVGNFPVFPTNIIGLMKVSRNNQKIAVATAGRLEELFDFDPGTGQVSNPISLPITAPNLGYGICFSPDDSKVYVSEAAGSQGNGYNIFQFDLSGGNAATIINSKTLLGLVQAPLAVAGDLQVAPDDKIYFTRPMISYLGVIPFPDLKAPQCGFINNGISLGTAVSYWGLPNQIRAGNRVPKIRLGNDTILCPG